MSNFLAIVEETLFATSTTTGNPQRIITSENGLVWTEVGELRTPQGVFSGRLWVKDGVVYTGSQSGFFAPHPSGADLAWEPYNGVARSLDGGLTWQGVVPASEMPQAVDFLSTCLMSAGADLGGNVMLATGEIIDDPDEYPLFRSTDGGQTFVKWNPASLGFPLGNDVASLGDGVALLASGANAGRIARTTDSGETWTIINLTSPQSTVRMFAPLTSSRVLAFDTRHMWKSTDGGVNWTRTANVVGASATIRIAFACNELNVVLGLQANTSTDKPFRFSADGGVTWATGAYASSFGFTTAVPKQFCLGPDGAVYCITGEVTQPNTPDGEIWRGVVSGSSITWTKVHSISFKYLGCQMVGIAYVAAPTDTTTPDTGLTGRNDMLVLSSTTRKWTSYAY